jgi:hypothetical protein
MEVSLSLLAIVTTTELLAGRRVIIVLSVRVV